MRTAKQYTNVIRLNMRSEVRDCPFCQCSLRRVATFNQRYIATLHQVLDLDPLRLALPARRGSGITGDVSQRSGRWAGSSWLYLWPRCAHAGWHVAAGRAPHA